VIVLDASAAIALFRREPGWELIDESATDAVMSAVNLGEVVQRQLRLNVSRIETERLMAELGVLIVDVDADLAMDAAELRHKIPGAGLSQADCICLALAKRMNVVAMTTDRDWAGVADAVGVKVRLAR
jgi:ribonuclease VapC